MNKSLLVFLVVLSSLLVAHANRLPREEKCDLNCWIKNLEVHINDEISFNEKVLSISIEGTIKNLTLKDLELGQIISSKSSPTAAQPSFFIKVNVVHAYAEGLWSGKSAFGNCKGNAFIEVENIVLGMTLIFNKNKTDGLITSVEARDCDKNFALALKDMDIDFQESSGFISAIDTILKLFHSSIGDFAKKLATGMSSTISDAVPGMICPMLEEMIRTNVTDLFHQANDMIHEFWRKGGEQLDIAVIAEDMVDLHISPIIDTARFLFGKFIGINGPLNLSYVVDIFSKGTGVLRLKDLYDEALEFPIEIPDLNATLTLGIDDIVIDGLKTWRNFSLLSPVNYSDVTLYSHTDLEYLAITLKWHIIVDVDGDTISVGGKTLSENATFYVQLRDNVMDFYLQLASYDGLAGNYSNRMCMNTTCMEALLCPESTGITFFTLNMTFENLSLSADKGDLEEDVRSLINNVVGMFVDHYTFAIPSFVNGLVMNYLPLLNDLLYDLLEDAACDDDPDEVVSEVDVAVTVGSVGGASVLTALLMVLPCSGLFMKKKRIEDGDGSEGAEMSDLATTYVDASMPTKEDLKNDKDSKYLFKNCKCGGTKLREFFRIDEKGASMFFDPRLGLATRIIIPLLLFCTFAMFLSANTGVGASVFVVMTLGEFRDVTLPSLFDFGLINTIEDMWTAGVYPLSILVAFFSGIWPYLKVVLMILCWFLPKKIFSEKARGTMLEWLDILGKWSLLDTYVMIMMLVAFHFNIRFPILNSDDIAKPTQIQIFVYPAYGFLALILGTLISLLMSHVLLGLHRYIQPDDHMNDCDDAQRMRPMICYSACGQSGGVRLFTRIGLTVGLVLSMIMMILGTVLNTFSFDFVGLVGWLFPMLDIDPHRAYSVLSLTDEVPPSAQEPNSFTVRFTQVVFIMTAFVFPVLHIASMLVLWLVPFKRKVQHYLRYACEVLSAWSCVDVFIISIIAACLEIQQFAGFMVGDKCDFLTPYLDEFLGEFLGEYKSCFEVVATLESGCYVLFIGTILYTFIYMTFNRVVEAGLRTRGNDGIPMTKEQVKELNDRGKNKKKDKKDKKKKESKPKQSECEGEAFGEINQSNGLAGISTSNKSFVSTLSIAAAPDGSAEIEEDEGTDSSVDDLEAPPPEAPLPPSEDVTV